MTVFVGINLSHHPGTGLPTADGGVAIAIDGVVGYACAEERVSRSKYDGGFRHSLRNGLAALGLATADIDAVGLVRFGQQVGDELPAALTDEVRAEVGPRARLFYCSSHHEGHAWAAIGQLALDDALVVVIDRLPRGLPHGVRHCQADGMTHEPQRDLAEQIRSKPPSSARHHPASGDRNDQL